MNAIQGKTVNDHHYSCSCPMESATLTYHDHDKIWRCRGNEEVRQQLGEVFAFRWERGKEVTFPPSKNMHA